MIRIIDIELSFWGRVRRQINYSVYHSHSFDRNNPAIRQHQNWKADRSLSFP